jgi:hypothetical protein
MSYWDDEWKDDDDVDKCEYEIGLKVIINKKEGEYE